MTAVFVAGAHTDVGKTYVACGLIRAARADGLEVEALKPVASGFDIADWEQSDPGRLLDALGRPPTNDALDAITPWRFARPWRRRWRPGWSSATCRSRRSSISARPERRVPVPIC